jgi:hypothetical protein
MRFPRERGTLDRGLGVRKDRILKFVVGSFRLGSVPEAEGSVVDVCYEIWE